ncbi:hypothetical protein J6590_038984 [Homalodisca vitripennis]|nr:hypothetical protein J6590_038984 [Homalodisca vitripennis]
MQRELLEIIYRRLKEEPGKSIFQYLCTAKETIPEEDENEEVNPTNRKQESDNGGDSGGSEKDTDRNKVMEARDLVEMSRLTVREESGKRAQTQEQKEDPSRVLYNMHIGTDIVHDSQRRKIEKRSSKKK